MDGMGMVIWFKPARPSSVAFNPRVPQLKSRAKESTTHLHKHLAGWVIDPWKPIVCWAGWRCATNSDKINSELQAIGNPSVHPDLSEHFRLQVSPCTAVLLYVYSTLCKSQIETCFSLVSRGKRGLGGFLGNILLRQFRPYLFMGPTKIAQNCCTNQKLLRNQPILQLYQCHIRGFRMTFGPRLISYSAKIWTKMRPNIKGHQKNGSVPKWIEFDTNRSNTFKYVENIEAWIETTTFKISKSWG